MISVIDLQQCLWELPVLKTAAKTCPSRPAAPPLIKICVHHTAFSRSGGRWPDLVQSCKSVFSLICLWCRSVTTKGWIYKVKTLDFTKELQTVNFFFFLLQQSDLFWKTPQICTGCVCDLKMQTFQIYTWLRFSFCVSEVYNCPLFCFRKYFKYFFNFLMRCVGPNVHFCSSDSGKVASRCFLTVPANMCKMSLCTLGGSVSYTYPDNKPKESL